VSSCGSDPFRLLQHQYRYSVRKGRLHRKRRDKGVVLLSVWSASITDAQLLQQHALPVIPYDRKHYSKKLETLGTSDRTNFELFHLIFGIT
jgi:hypothetical protein